MRKIIFIVSLLTVSIFLFPKDTSFEITADSFEAVVLLPGYGGSLSWSDELRTRRIGTGVRYFMPKVGEMDSDLALLAKDVLKQIDSEKISNFSIVGYSAGGVLARKVAELAPDRVYKVVMVASPHQGSPLASLGALLNSPACTVSCRQLVKDSEFLSELAKPKPEDRWLSVFSLADEVVPSDSANLSGSTPISLDGDCSIAGLSHSEVPKHPKTVSVIELFLTDKELIC